jgi:hypothetical protein
MLGHEVHCCEPLSPQNAERVEKLRRALFGVYKAFTSDRNRKWSAGGELPVGPKRSLMKFIRIFRVHDF